MSPRERRRALFTVDSLGCVVSLMCLNAFAALGHPGGWQETAIGAGIMASAASSFYFVLQAATIVLTKD